MKYTKVKIGLLIEQRVNDLGLNKSEFARKIGISNQYINRLFEKSSIDTDKLIAISEALDYDFFANFRPVDSTKGGQKVIAKGPKSVAALYSDVKVGDASFLQEKIRLEEKVKSLESLLSEKDKQLAEKERTIKILMERK